jgi:hypothetical protein
MGRLLRILKRRRRPGEIATARTAIRNHCLECCGYDPAEVRRCTAPQCWLWPYRLGRSGPLDESWPAGTGVGNDGELIEAAFREPQDARVSI